MTSSFRTDDEAEGIRMQLEPRTDDAPTARMDIDSRVLHIDGLETPSPQYTTRTSVNATASSASSICDQHVSFFRRILLFITIVLCVPCLIALSVRFAYIVRNPTTFTYTTYVFTKKQDRDITFIYSANNSNLFSDQSIYYQNSKKKWSNKYKAGDIGTCVRALYPPVVKGGAEGAYAHQVLSNMNWVQHQDT
eukprot:762449_1